jgi:hypothetical protein
MDPRRKTATHPKSENDGRDKDMPEARKEAAGELLSPAMPPAGAGAMLDADPRLDETSETEQALERTSEPSDTNEPAEANQRRKSGNRDVAGG